MSAATSRLVQRALSGTGPWATIATVTPTATTYNDTDVTNGTTYYYRIIGVNAEGNSEPSNVASATPAANTFLLEDTFTDTNGTDITAHTPDNNPAGNSYTKSTTGITGFEINNNTLALASGTNSGSTGYVAMELASSPENITVIATGTSWRDAYVNRQGITIRKTSNIFTQTAGSSGGYWIGLDELGPNFVIRDGYHLGTILDSTAITWANGDSFTITITCTGDTIDADLTLNGTDYSLTYGSATSRGVYFGFLIEGSTSGRDWVDSWSVEEN